MTWSGTTSRLTAGVLSSIDVRTLVHFRACEVTVSSERGGGSTGGLVYDLGSPGVLSYQDWFLQLWKALKRAPGQALSGDCVESLALGRLGFQDGLKLWFIKFIENDTSTYKM